MPNAPQLTSLSRSDAAFSRGATVDYIATFSAPVTNVTTGAFSLVTHGLTGAQITGVSAVAGSNGTQYLVSIAPGNRVGHPEHIAG